MNITNVRLRKILADGTTKAIVSVTLDHSFVVHDIKVIDGRNGLFVAMPSRRTSLGEFRDIAHPISQMARGIIQEKVLDAYFEALQEEQLTAQESTDTHQFEQVALV